MPAYFESGFSVRQPMWHGLGNVLDQYPEDWAEARKFAGLEWEPVRVTANRATMDETDMIASGLWTAGGAHDLTQTIDLVEADTRIIYRSDRMGLPTGELGRVSGGRGQANKGWSPFYNGWMGDVLQAFEKADAKVQFETAGAVGNNGQKVYALSFLNEPFTVAGDDSECLPFIGVLNAHDGSGAVYVVNTMVRVVCWNTYHAALASAQAAGRAFKIRHVGDITDDVEQAKRAILGLRKEVEEFKTLAEELYAVEVTDKRLEHFLHDFIPVPVKLGPAATADEQTEYERKVEATERGRKLFRELYASPITNASHTGTGMGLLNAATEQLDHGGKRSGAALDRSFFSGHPDKARAVKLIRGLSGR